MSAPELQATHVTCSTTTSTAGSHEVGFGNASNRSSMFKSIPNIILSKNFSPRSIFNVRQLYTSGICEKHSDKYDSSSQEGSNLKQEFVTDTPPSMINVSDDRAKISDNDMLRQAVQKLSEIDSFEDEFSKLKYWEKEYEDRTEISVVGDGKAHLDESSKFWQRSNDGLNLPFLFNSNDLKRECNNAANQIDLSNKTNGSNKLSHVDSEGKASMVDVSHKAVSVRTASARATVFLDRTSYELIALNRMKKGDVLATARLAGIMAAKKTSELIPLCHPIPIEHINVNARLETRETEDVVDEKLHIQQNSHEYVAVNESATKYSVELTATVTTVGRTGVEMEALTGVTVAALTVYDMCKAVTHDITVQRVQLVSKTGGKRDFRREL